MGNKVDPIPGSARDIRAWIDGIREIDGDFPWGFRSPEAKGE